jgi:hypothetical protein
MRQELVNYAPDLDPATPGIMVDCTNFIPSFKGYKGGYSPLSTGLPALAAACVGSAVLFKLDASNRFFAGTATKLYEAASTSWTDVSRATAYNAGVDNRWHFAQFGNVSLAVNKGDVIQASTSGAFADLTAPKASMIETVGQFVFVGDTTEGTYGDSPDRWWCCAIGDHTDWTPSVATQCDTGRFLSTSGKLRACKRLGDQIVFYKEKAIYLGSYVGTAGGTIWDFVEIPGDAGAISQDTVVNIGTTEAPVHLLMGYDNFYIFDGSRPRPIGNPLKLEVFKKINRQYAHRSCTLHDRLNGLVYFFYPSSSSNGTIDKCVVYNYKMDKWGRADRNIEIAVEYIASGDTWDTLANRFSTWDSWDGYTWDLLFSTGAAPVPAIVDTSHMVGTMNGPSVSSDFTTGDYGDNIFLSLLTRVKPQFIVKPTSATMVNYYKSDSGETLTTGATTTMSSSRFDLLRSSRWHRVKLSFVGDVEISSINYDFTQDGEE